MNGSNRLRSKEDSLPLSATTTLHSSTERTDAASPALRDNRTSSAHASPLRGSKALAPACVFAPRLQQSGLRRALCRHTGARRASPPKITETVF
ncbi:MAG TPA: hypothetical protein VGB73_07255 [Pyrinomonadaceae bacterium]